MELPHLGKHCSVKSCNQLDFLPMKCDSCAAILCKDHIKYDEHQCPTGLRKDVQIPVCPLCNKAVSSANRDQSPDVIISAHIDRDCKSDPALKKREKVYSNKCSFVSCKQREAIQVKCDKCLQTFCLKHRFAEDHKCQGFQATGRAMNRAGAAALERFSKSKVPVENQPQSTTSASPIVLDGDDDLALAIKLSLNQATQEDQDYLLAKALEESEREDARRRQTNSIKSKA